MPEDVDRIEEVYRRWLETAWRGRRPPAPADWRDAAALGRALRSGVREVGELRRVTGLSPARCGRAARLVESLLRFLVEWEPAPAGPSQPSQTEGDARPQ